MTIFEVFIGYKNNNLIRANNFNNTFAYKVLYLNGRWLENENERNGAEGVIWIFDNWYFIQATNIQTHRFFVGIILNARKCNYEKMSCYGIDRTGVQLLHQ